MTMRNMEGTGFGLNSSSSYSGSPLVVTGFEEDSNENRDGHGLFGAGDESIDRMETQLPDPGNLNHDSEGSGGLDAEDDEDDNTAADKNEEFSQAELSSVGSLPADEAPAISSLIWLGTERCRVHMRIKRVVEGGYADAVCGNIANQCGHRGHLEKQKGGSLIRGRPGYYVGLPTPKGRVTNGLREANSPYSQEDYAQFKAAEENDFTTLGEAFAAATDEGSSEAETVTEQGDLADSGPTTESRGSNVRFGGVVTGEEGTPNLETPIQRGSARTNQIDASNNTRDGRQPPLDDSQKNTDRSGSFIYGMLDGSLFPCLVDSLTEKRQFEATGWTTIRTFPNWDGAGTWLSRKLREYQSNRDKNTGSISVDPPREVQAQRQEKVPKTKEAVLKIQYAATTLYSGKVPMEEKIFGMLNSTRFPNLVDEPKEKRRMESSGWRLDQAFQDWETAGEWLQEKLKSYGEARMASEKVKERARSRIPPDKTRMGVKSSLTDRPKTPITLSRSEVGISTDLPEEAGYVGLEKHEPFQRIGVSETLGIEGLNKYIEKGFIWIKRFPDVSSVTRWVKQGRAAVIGMGVGTTPSPTVVDLTTSDSPTNPGGTRAPPVPQDLPLFMIGDDPSKGDESKIYGLDVMERSKLDAALVPGGLPEGKDTLDLFERFMDVVALPGNSAGRSDEFGEASEQAEMITTVEIAAIAMSQTVAGGKSRRGLLFQATRYNQLAKIKSEQELLQMTKDVRSAAREDLKAQSRHVSSFMYARRYPQQAITTYLNSGGLPLMILRTLESYKALLEAIISATREMPGQRWTGSQAQTMVEFHGKRLADIRLRSETYRDLLIENYMYLRDSEAKKFQDESFHRIIWNRLAELSAEVPSGVSGPGGGPTSGGVSDVGRCGHCKHKLGHETANCPLSRFSSSVATSLLKTANRAKAKELIKAFKERVTVESTEDEIKAAVTAVRAEHLS